MTKSQAKKQTSYRQELLALVRMMDKWLREIRRREKACDRLLNSTARLISKRELWEMRGRGFGRFGKNRFES